MKTYFARIGNFTVHRAKELGEEAGIAAAARYRYDPGSFEDTPNPFGIDSEQWRPTQAWILSERDEFPRELAVNRQNEFKDLAVLSVI